MPLGLFLSAASSPGANTALRRPETVGTREIAPRDAIGANPCACPTPRSWRGGGGGGGGGGERTKCYAMRREKDRMMRKECNARDSSLKVARADIIWREV